MLWYESFRYQIPFLSFSLRRFCRRRMRLDSPRRSSTNAFLYIYIIYCYHCCYFAKLSYCSNGEKKIFANATWPHEPFARRRLVNKNQSNDRFWIWNLLRTGFVLLLVCSNTFRYSQCFKSHWNLLHKHTLNLQTIDVDRLRHDTQSAMRSNQSTNNRLLILLRNRFFFWISNWTARKSIWRCFASRSMSQCNCSLPSRMMRN